MRVAVCGGSLQGTELCFLAKKAGWHVDLVDRRERPNALHLADSFIRHEFCGCPPPQIARALMRADIVIPAMENKRALLDLHSYCAQKDIPLAFDPRAWQITRDKVKSRDLFAQCHVPYPEVINQPDDFPYILKPVLGSGSRGIALIANERDRQSHGIDLSPGGAWLAERYHPGRQYSLEICGRPGNYRTFLATEILVDESYDCNCVLAPAPHCGMEEELESALRSLAESLGLVGIMDIEAIEAAKGMRVLEVDARFPSQTPIAIWLASGINLAQCLASCFVPCPPASGRSFARVASYMHVCRSNGELAFPGEHCLSGPLRLLTLPNGVEALAGAGGSSGDWNAVLFLAAETWAELEIKRKQSLEILTSNPPQDFI